MLEILGVAGAGLLVGLGMALLFALAKRRAEQDALLDLLRAAVQKGEETIFVLFGVTRVVDGAVEPVYRAVYSDKRGLSRARAFAKAARMVAIAEYGDADPVHRAVLALSREAERLDWVRSDPHGSSPIPPSLSAFEAVMAKWGEVVDADFTRVDAARGGATFRFLTGIDSGR